ncbi:glutamyl-tRNA reductase [Verrucomicrobia bacterium IMCC26134]|nr:glutamyl-tRNA reductase [Verrucomicrobia bacterium IMCC26134]
MTPHGPLFFHLGASHQTTPLAHREKLALPPERAAELHARLASVGVLREVALLNTCNRVEFYAVAADADALVRLENAFCELQSIAPADFAAFRQHTAGPEAIRHLIAVAAGLESQLLGENEIFGQVKVAYEAAQSAGTTGPVLNRVFQKAFQAAKHIRTNTGISGGQVSTANVAVELALTIFGDLTKARVLLLGAGEIGEKTAKAFLSRGAAALTVSSRTAERAMELARVLDATALPFEHFHNHLETFDIVVSATSAPDAIILPAHVSTAMRKRRARPLFFIDLALPRDIHTGVADLENVFLYNLDDLGKIAAQNLATREADVARARVLIAEKADALWQQLLARHS